MAIAHTLYISGLWAKDWRGRTGDGSVDSAGGAEGGGVAHTELPNEMPFLGLAIQWVLIAGNALFFADRVVWNCAQKSLLDEQAKAKEANEPKSKAESKSKAT
jgi:hypothetical protein